VPKQPASPVVVKDPRYLQLATTLLQRMRLDSPEGGIWEAADIQWWYRGPRSTDADGQLFWLDEDGQPVAAVIRTDHGYSNVECDVLVGPADPEFARTVWRAAIGRVEELKRTAEFPVLPDDTAGVAELRAAGYEPAEEPDFVSTWLKASRRPPVSDLAPGYRLLSRAQAPDGPHPMQARNGPQVEEWLNRCSLYRPELDLMVRAPDGETAGYGLFWADPVTKVGLVEPMRTEDAHQGRGIASHVLTTGLNLLAEHGCERLKVSNDIGLYLRAGFRPTSWATAYARPVTR
jgi:GNAT superfamily N-acetyltransferase